MQNWNQWRPELIVFSCFKGNLPVFVLNSRWLHFIWVRNYPFSWLASVITCTTAFVLRHSIEGHALSYLRWPSSLSWIIFFRTTTIALNMKNMMPTTIKMMNSIFHGDSTSICLLLKIGVRAFSLSVEWNLKQLTSGKWGEVLIGSLDWHVRGFEPDRGHYFVPLPLPCSVLLAEKLQSRSLSLHSPTKQPNFWALHSFMFIWPFVYDNHETFRYTITPMSKIESDGSHHLPANFYVTYWPKINCLRRNI